MSTPEICKICKQSLRPTKLPALEGRDGDYRVRLLDFPVLACPADHERWYIYKEFGPDLIEGVYELNKACFTRRKGLLTRVDHCSRCDTALDSVPETTSTLDMAIRVRQGNAFALQIAGPLLKCRTCSHSMIRDTQTNAAELCEALAQAMSANSIRPR